MAAVLQLRRGVIGDKPSLAAGEFYVSTTNDELYLGTDGSGGELLLAKLNSTNIGDFLISGDLTIGGNIVAPIITAFNNKFAAIGAASASWEGGGTDISALNAFTSSQNTKNTTLETVTSSLDTRLDDEEAATTIFETKFTTIGTQSGSWGSGADITALNAFTQSQNTKNTTLENTTGSIIIFTGSALLRLSSLETATSSFETKFATIGTQSGSWGSGVVPAGTISGSAQITAFGFVSGSYETTGRGIISGSSQITPLLPTGVVSGSTQVIALLPTGTVSGSSQVLGGSGVYSSSAQISGFETTGRGIVSSSTQIVSLLPTGVVSGSSQVLGGSGVWSGSGQLPTGVLSGSAQITAFGFVSGSYETTGRGIVSSSAQIVGLGFTTTSSFNAHTTSIHNWSQSVEDRFFVIEAASGSWGAGGGLIGAISTTATIALAVNSNTLTAIAQGGIISSSAQITGFETNGRSIISGAQQITDLGFGTGGGVTSSYLELSGSTFYTSGSSIENFNDTGSIFLGYETAVNASSAYESVFIGSGSGHTATNANNSVFIGKEAGKNSTNSANSNFFGTYAGQGAPTAPKSNFIGYLAGSGATNSNNSNFIGESAGQGATDATYSNFIGAYAGTIASNAFDSNFIGQQAGYLATNAYHSNFIGKQAGQEATSANTSNFIGHLAGQGATNANGSNFIGLYAGQLATTANGSNFIGYQTAYAASNAAYSNIIGYNSGKRISGSGIGVNNIIIGTNITLENNRRDSINFGGIIFATGSYGTTSGGPLSGSVGNGKVGINITIPSASLHVSGNLWVTNTLTASLAEGYTWVGGTGNVSTLVATSSFGGGGGSTDISALNAFTQSQNTKNTTLENVTASIHTFTASALTRFTSIESATASFETKFATIGTQSGSWGGGTNITALNQYTQSQDTKNTTLESVTASLQLYTASNDTKWDNLAGQSGSWVTETESGSFLITASVSSNTITFTKGNNTTFDITVAGGASIPAGTISGSAQITAFGFVSGSYEETGRGIISGSAQITPLLPTGVISSSLQVLGGSGVWSSSTQMPAGVISSSTQLDMFETTGRGIISSSVQVLGGSNVWSGAAQLPVGVVSGSSQIDGTQITNNSITIAGTQTALGGTITLETITGGSGIFSGSIPGIPVGTVSGSAQITAFGFVSGSYEETGRGIISGSSQITPLLPNGVVSGSSQVSYLGLSNIPNGIISSSTQLENATITNLTITNLTTINETASVIYSSGSNQFGDQLSDTQILSGSVQIVGGLTVNGVQVSTQSFVDLTPLNQFTSSANTSITSLNNATSSYETNGRGIVSSSVQVTELLPVGVVSGSSQVLGGSGVWSSSAQLPTGVISSSAQLTEFETNGRGIISSSTQIIDFGFVTTSSFNSYTASISTASLVDRLNAIENVSGSWITESETGSFLTSLNGAISSSSQLTASYDARYELQGREIVSSSAQLIELNTFTGSANSRLNNLELFTSSVPALTSLNSFTQSILGTNSWTASVDTKWNTLGTQSGSWVTEAETGSFLITASVSGQTLTFTKGDTSTFDILIPTASYFTSSISVSGSVTISGSVNNVDYIDFNTASVTPAWKSGRVFWDDTDGCLAVYNAEADVTLQVGQENWTRVYNASGVVINNGQPVRIIGTHGDAPQVVLAKSIAVSGSVNLVNQILGIATHTIEVGTFGYITTQGLVRGLNTNAFTDGDTLFLGTGSAGTLQANAPVAPYEIIPIGQVVKASPGTSGVIYVAIQQPLDFSDLSSVLVEGTFSDGDMWQYVGSGVNGVWKHRTVSEIGLVTTSSFNSYTSSTNSRLTSIESATASFEAKFATIGTQSGSWGGVIIPAGTVSGSSQLTSSYDTRYELQGRGIVSGSAQVTPLLPTNTVSSSAQITAFGFISSSANEPFTIPIVEPLPGSSITGSMAISASAVEAGAPSVWVYLGGTRGQTGNGWVEVAFNSIEPK